MSISAIIYNGKIVPSNQPCIKCNDRGFTLGHGLFDTILINKSAIPALDYHWKRLNTSAPILGITLPFSYQELFSMLNNLIIENNLQDKLAGARVTVTHGESDRGILPQRSPKTNFVITVFEHTPIAHKKYSAIIAKTRKNEFSQAATVKSISYLDNILAKQEAMDKGYDEAILLNTSSKIADGSISNIYMVKNNQILTPPVEDGALPGVVRSILIEELKQTFSIVEASITPMELLNADEIFLTNALMGVRPLTHLENKKFLRSDITNKVSKAFQHIKKYF